MMILWNFPHYYYVAWMETIVSTIEERIEVWERKKMRRDLLILPLLLVREMNELGSLDPMSLTLSLWDSCLCVTLSRLLLLLLFPSPNSSFLAWAFSIDWNTETRYRLSTRTLFSLILSSRYFFVLLFSLFGPQFIHRGKHGLQFPLPSRQWWLVFLSTSYFFLLLLNLSVFSGTLFLTLLLFYDF